MPRVLFAGPTRAGLEESKLRAAAFDVRPPARRGDIAALSEGAPGIIVLVDGWFHQALSVGHAELRTAIRSGWTVWGLGSLGAIRAFEMRHLGMRGFGRIYEHFLGEEDFQDDELALLHAPEPPYLAASEPLVHLRYFIAGLETDAVVAPSAARAIAHELKQMWFGDRTIDATLSLIEHHAGPAATAAARERLQLADTWRVKRYDLAEFLEREVWLTDSYRPLPRPMPYGTPIARPRGDPAAPPA